MKVIVTVLVIAFVLSTLFGWFGNLQGMALVVNGEMVSPLITFVAGALGVIALISLGVLITMSIVGAILFALVISGVTALVIGLSAFWPMFLFAAVIYWAFIKEDKAVVS